MNSSQIAVSQIAASKILTSSTQQPTSESWIYEANGERNAAEIWFCTDCLGRCDRI